MKNKRVGILDLFVIIIKHKKFFILTLFPTLIISYLLIFFFISPQFDSESLIIPAEDNSISGLAGLFSDLPNLPFGFSASSPELSLYTTIIYSRTMLEEIVDKYDLINVYKISKSAVDYKEKALETLKDNIKADETENNAYKIKVRTPDANLSAKITNFIVNGLNKKLLQLKVKKSKDNKEFLEERLKEIKDNLKTAEDSLLSYQKKTGLLSVEEQIKQIMNAYTTLESSLLAKEIQVEVLRKIVGEESREFKDAQIQTNEYKAKLELLNKKGSEDGLLLGISSLPDNVLEYFRLMREVEINSKMLQFLLPLYEQARIEEQKKIPLLQIIDYAVPAPKKSFPPRILLTLIITFTVFTFLLLYIAFKENSEVMKSEKVKFITDNLFKWNLRE